MRYLRIVLCLCCLFLCSGVTTPASGAEDTPASGLHSAQPSQDETSGSADQQTPDSSASSDDTSSASADSGSSQPLQDNTGDSASAGQQTPESSDTSGAADPDQAVTPGQGNADASADTDPAQPPNYASDSSQYRPQQTDTQGSQPGQYAMTSLPGTRTMSNGSISQQVSTCMDLSKNDGASMEDLQQMLLVQLRQNAVNVLFGKVYYQQSTGLDKKNYASKYTEQVAKQLEFQTEPEFYNGKQFGSLCVRAWVSMPAQRVPTISPRQVRLDNFCYQTEPGQSRETLRKLATTAAVDRVLENIAPGTLVPLQFRQQIEDGSTINGSIRKLDERTYCLSISVNVIPLQVNMLANKEEKAKEAPAIKEPKPGFSLNLKNFKEGDLTPDFGENIAVFKDTEGKSLGSNSRKGATAMINLSSKTNYKALIYIKKDIPYDFLHSEDLLLFTLHYKNNKYEPYSFKLTLTDDNQPMAYFRSWSYSTEAFRWANAANFNEYRVEKKDGLIVFFYNGKFMYNFPSEGDELVQIKVPLRWNDRFYNVLIYDEAPNPGDTQQ